MEDRIEFTKQMSKINKRGEVGILDCGHLIVSFIVNDKGARFEKRERASEKNVPEHI